MKNNIIRNVRIGDLVRIKSIKPSACQSAAVTRRGIAVELWKNGSGHPISKTHGIEQSPTATAMRPYPQQATIRSNASQSATPMMNR